MKTALILCSTLVATVLFSSCGVNQAFVLNQNQNTTQVQLGESNFRYVGKAIGADSVSYVLFFGGMNKKRLFANAYGAMVNNADLGTGARALVNVVTEEHLGGVPPFYYTRTLTVSGNVIEFTK